MMPFEHMATPINRRIEISDLKIRRARKDHTCSLCFCPINKGDRYAYKRLTPWCHPENECFDDYKAHIECDVLWLKVGSDSDYILPADKQDWAEMTYGMNIKNQPVDYDAEKTG